ncbi:MAG: hypothetical protein AB7M12_02560 [Hyphomonadaceae bacterium]
MDELSFKPAGAAFVAVVAALAPSQTVHAAPPAQAPGLAAVAAHDRARAQETAARDALGEAAARLGPAAPFSELSTETTPRQPILAKGQLGLPFEE